MCDIGEKFHKILTPPCVLTKLLVFVISGIFNVKLRSFEIDVAAGNTGNDSPEHDGFSGLFFIQRRFRIL